MTHISRAVLALFAIALLVTASGAGAQTPPNPYRLLDNWAQIPANMNGGKWGEVIGVKPGPDGKHLVCCTAASMSCRPAPPPASVAMTCRRS